MTVVYYIVLFLHLVGAAMVVGPWIANMKSPTVHPRQFDGAMLQVITGLAMYIMLMAHVMPYDANHMKLGIKFLIAIVIAVAATIAKIKSKKGQPISLGLAHAVGGLGLVNIAIAALWH
ncbi:hypothetical protein [Arthrobacter sp. RAF14]|uniref:hypothetical protein n=1 Tax=Arthrobacter sp. RAF14 TaxID=3233051 RepID=UPI003F8FF82A